ncbi:DUF1819 family protein [Aquirufa antheringensis]|uniref:DUF1819 family protein n=1 Tax=Aquirufa antheringensis TaxID=2516559 RepID=UPI0022A8F78A|nr:DUF1819 family protein [Aquirufa antheringensis]MCZ2489272.1 DUF1819 family protein [Aquirufa antheringensis]
MAIEYKYDFSFTASSLRLPELLLVAKAIIDGREIDVLNELGGGKTTTGKRMYAEFLKRLNCLTKEQLEILVNSDLITQKQIALLANCKAYSFIRDFIIEVVREKLLVYDYDITDGDYLRFYRRKLDVHEELQGITEQTEKKIKQVLFKILEQSGIINDIKNRVIQPQLLDFKLMEAIAKDNPNWLKVLLVSDYDIARVNE